MDQQNYHTDLLKSIFTVWDWRHRVQRGWLLLFFIFTNYSVQCCALFVVPCEIVKRPNLDAIFNAFITIWLIFSPISKYHFLFISHPVEIWFVAPACAADPKGLTIAYATNESNNYFIQFQSYNVRKCKNLALPDSSINRVTSSLSSFDKMVAKRIPCDKQ